MTDESDEDEDDSEHNKLRAKVEHSPSTNDVPTHIVEDFFEEYVPDQSRRKRRVLPPSQQWVHRINWEKRHPRWDGTPVPKVPANRFWKAMKDRFSLTHARHCKLDGCSRVFNNSAGLEKHILSKDHIYLRTICKKCKYAARPDGFASRHRCPAGDA